MDNAGDTEVDDVTLQLPVSKKSLGGLGGLFFSLSFDIVSFCLLFDLGLLHIDSVWSSFSALTAVWSTGLSELVLVGEGVAGVVYFLASVLKLRASWANLGSTPARSGDDAVLKSSSESVSESNLES